MPCASPYGEWTSSEIKLIFRDVKPDPKPSMIMLQMIADAYEERHRVWEFNKDKPRQKVHNLMQPAMFGPINKAQKTMDKPVTQKAVAQELTTPSSDDRSHKTRKTLKPSASMKIRYVLYNLNIGKMPQAPSLPRKIKRKAAPADPTPRLRPVGFIL
ncbi:hypothetical protein C0993_011999 [Termitomyces sp. T159_Od127]|nr:hypothetical protein C0993_011999 [Termitomyces sp. T159_Od127]